MSGADRKKSGYLNQVNLSKVAASINQSNPKRTRIQTNTLTTGTTTDPEQKKWSFEMDYIDHRNQHTIIVFGPLPFVDLINAINKKLMSIYKENPSSNGIKRLLDCFSDTKIQPITAALHNPVYCLPTNSLQKSNALEACSLNNSQHMVLARITEHNEIALLLRMHPVYNNYQLYMETPLLLPQWLENDAREAMAILIETSSGMLKRNDNVIPQYIDINLVTTAIMSATFCMPYPNIKYVYQFLCPTFSVYFQAPTQKIENTEFSNIATSAISPSLSESFIPPDDFYDLPYMLTPRIPSSLFQGVSSPLDLSSPIPIYETTPQLSTPLIFSKKINSNSNIIRSIPKQNHVYKLG